MADDTRALRERIEERRSDITETVEQIENRIMPGRIVARRSNRVRRTMSGWKDAVLGSDDDPSHRRDPWDAYRSGPAVGAHVEHGEHGGPAGRAGTAVATAHSTLGDTVHDAPEAVRQRTTGNPLTAGAVALGIGWIVGSALPKTQREQALAHRVEPVLGEAAHGVVEQGKALAEELREPAHDAIDHVQRTGAGAAGELSEEATGAVRSVRHDAQGPTAG